MFSIGHSAAFLVSLVPAVSWTLFLFMQGMCHLTTVHWKKQLSSNWAKKETASLASQHQSFKCEGRADCAEEEVVCLIYTISNYRSINSDPFPWQ